MTAFEDHLNQIGRKAGEVARKLGDAQAQANAGMGGGSARPKVIRAATLARDVLPDVLTYEPVRQSPKGTQLESQSAGKVVLRFKAAIRTWWMLPYTLLPFTVIGGIPLGLFVGTYMNPFELGVSSKAYFGWQSGSLFWVPVLMLVATVASWYLTQPWVRVIATSEFIQVGNKFYDRREYEGMRLGYSLQTQSGILKNDFHDVAIGLQGIRLQYGLWGEDLKYLVSGYHANEIVLWLNWKINETVARAPQTVAETGQRQQSF